MDVREIFPSTKVLVIGDIMLDRYIRGVVERISPEAPVPILLQDHVDSHPGGAANVAVNLQQLGAEVYLAGVIGRDAHGAVLIEALKSLPIDLRYVLIANRKTTTKTRVMAASQHLLRIDDEERSDLDDALEQEMLQLIKRAIATIRPDIVVLQDYNKGVLTKNVIRTTIALAKEVGTFVAVDPKYRHFFEYVGVDLFKPNERELYGALKMNEMDRNALQEGVKRLCHELGARYVVVTLADRGMLIYEGRSMHHVPTRPRSIRDVCGAGDAVLSVLALSLYHGYDVVSAAQMANAAGGLVCERPGVCPIPTKEWMKEVRAMGILAR